MVIEEILSKLNKIMSLLTPLLLLFVHFLNSFEFATHSLQPALLPLRLLC